jgi:hypothetical protein
VNQWNERPNENRDHSGQQGLKKSKCRVLEILYLSVLFKELWKLDQDKTFSFLSQAFEDREETEIPHPIHPAWEERPWPSDVGESGFEFSF